MKKLGFGLMRLPVTDTNNLQTIDLETVTKMVDMFLEKGFTYFDTAYPYHGGMSETAVRKTLVERYPRELYQLADKMPVWLVTGKDDYRKFFDEQLKKCGVSYFDYYLLHTLDNGNYRNTDKFGGFEFVKRMKAEGKIKHIGFSFHDRADLLDRILTEHPEMEFVQLQLNYLDWDNDSIQSRQCYEVAVKHKTPVIVMEPVKGGVLADVPEEAKKIFNNANPKTSIASWAIRYAASFDNVIIVLSGMSSFRQMEDNISYMQDFKPLSNKEQEIIQKVTEIINQSIAIPCTACQYCIDDCPQKIPIPKYFSLYNSQHKFGINMLYENYYRNLLLDFNKASSCIKCKQCESHCPQHLEIADYMQEVARVFDK